MSLDSSIDYGACVGVQLCCNLGDWSGHGHKSMLNSVSHFPAATLSDYFKEARAEKMRFSTPPPTRRRVDKGVLSRVFSRGTREKDNLVSSSTQIIPLQNFFGMKNSHKTKGRKEANWVRFFEHGLGGEVASVRNTEEWMVDLSQLYLGFKFASGAHSRLYHGIYKDKPVAVKIIQPPHSDEDGIMAARLEKQFMREVNFLWRLSHRNVIKLSAACRNPPTFCIITEYLPGGSLRSFLRKLGHKLLPLEKLISIALDIARGMQYIHSQGIIHRDLKPENILFDEDLLVKIADFGIACEEYSDPLAEDPGTFRWMAPEMIKHKQYGKKVDVYSFGLVMWEMVSGRIPYEDMTPVQAAFAVVDKDLRPVVPKDCPAALGGLIEQCWASNPEKRPEFGRIVEDLEMFESIVAQGGALNGDKVLGSHYHRKWLAQLIQNIKSHPHSHGLGFFAPKLL